MKNILIIIFALATYCLSAQSQHLHVNVNKNNIPAGVATQGVVAMPPALVYDLKGFDTAMANSTNSKSAIRGHSVHIEWADGSVEFGTVTIDRTDPNRPRVMEFSRGGKTRFPERYTFDKTTNTGTVTYYAKPLKKNKRKVNKKAPEQRYTFKFHLR